MSADPSQTSAPPSSAGAFTKTAELNINAKPFTPSFGGGVGGETAPAANNQQQQQQQQSRQYNNNKQVNSNGMARLPAPPMPQFGMFNPMMMGPPPFIPGGGGMVGMMPPPMMMGGGFFPPQQQQMYPPNPMMMQQGGGKMPHRQPLNGAAPTVSVNPTRQPTMPGVTAPPPPPGAAVNIGKGVTAAASNKEPKAPLVFPRKVAILVLGGRGSGKTTQCEILAKKFNLLHIAGGSFVAEKKLPLVELKRVLGENFVEGVELGKAKSKSNPSSPNGDVNGDENAANATAEEEKKGSGEEVEEKKAETATPAASSSAAAAQQQQKPHEYNGVVLDRMVGLHEYDAYYLDAILRRFGMAVELVFLLMLDSEIAGERAKSRGDTKPVDHTRQMAEHRIQYAAVNTVYSPLKILHCVECDNMPVDAIARALERVTETHYGGPNKDVTAATLPPTPLVPHHPYTQGKCKLLTDFQKFYDLRQDMLVAVHDTPKPPVICPASLMSGIADGRMFVTPKQARMLVTAYTTLKADGQRVLLFKKTEKVVDPADSSKVSFRSDVYGINGIFHFCYHFTPYLEDFGIQMPPKPDAWELPQHGIEWVLDAECFSANGKTQIAVFDYLYLFGNKGNAQTFDTRKDNLEKFFADVSFTKENAIGTKALYGPAPLFFKQYVPAPDTRQLLPDPANPPFPIDGIVFQHRGGYKFGKDNAMYKWKPREKCTVDFRLDKAVDPRVTGGEWTFVPMVGGDKEEVPWPNARVSATDNDARRCDLCDGCVVECIKRENNIATTTTTTTTSGTSAASGGGQANKNNNNNNTKNSTGKPSSSTFAVWDFVRIRPEKPTPNRLEIAQVVDSMEHLTFDELVQRLENLGGVKK